MSRTTATRPSRSSWKRRPSSASSPWSATRGAGRTSSRRSKKTGPRRNFSSDSLAPRGGEGQGEGGLRALRDDDDLAAVADERRHDPTHDAHDDGAQEGRPESRHVEALDERGDQPEAERVEDEQEESQGDEGDGQREDDQHGPDHRVHQAEEQPTVASVS